MALIGFFVFGGQTVRADEAADRSPEPWRAPAADSVEADLRLWLRESAGTPREAEGHLAEAEPWLQKLYGDGDRLTAVVSCLAIGSQEIADVMAACSAASPEVGSLDWLESSDVPEFVRANVRLYVARALVRRSYYEQALFVVEGIEPTLVCDPAALLFYRSIAEHQLVRIDEAKQTVDLLLAGEAELPERYSELARLMQADLRRVEIDSLDHIARRMSDVGRRLGLGEADQRAQEVERGILASLDKLIEDLEEQQRRQQQQQQSAGGQQAATPMEESRSAELKGEGKVDPKDIGSESGWGDLPPRERQRVLQQIGREFPGHYRDLMEEYLKRLATDEREEQP